MKNRCSYKGFTILEMSIVIGVLSILMLIIFKGGHLIQMAYYAKDLNRLSKIENAIATYVDVNRGKLDTSSGYYDYSPLINIGLLEIDDIRSSIGSWFYYATTVCLNDTGTAHHLSALAPCRGGTDKYEHQAFFPSTSDSNSENANPVTIPLEVFCRISNIINDGPTDIWDSGVKTSVVAMVDFLEINHFRDGCSNFPNRISGVSDYITYILFKKERII